jgi:outer membrane protein TolC
LAFQQVNVQSAELSTQDAKDMVTLAVCGTYLQILAASARIQTAQAQIETAQVVYQQAKHRNQSGPNARIETSTAAVELQTQQQRLTSLVNDFEKNKLTGTPDRVTADASFCTDRFVSLSGITAGGH